MAQGNGNGADNPDNGTISNLTFCVALVATGYLMLEHWAKFAGPISEYLARKLSPEHFDIAMMLAPWIVGAVLLFGLQLLIATALRRLYFMVLGA